jgi:hypothetical protein
VADNTQLNPGSGGDTIATDDIGGVKYQWVKISYGAADAFTPVSGTNPLPAVANATAVTADQAYTPGTNNPITQTPSGLLRISDGGGAITVDTGPNLFTGRMEGVDAQDAPVTADPLLVGGQYSASTAKVSASGDTVTLHLSQTGQILDIHSATAADTTVFNNSRSSAATNVSLVSAPGANKRLVIVEIHYTRDSAGTGTMKLVSDPAGTPADVYGPHYFAANGGMIPMRCYIPFPTNKAIGYTTTGTYGNDTLSGRAIVENV